LIPTYDLYGELLTEKQQKYFQDYYFSNLSYSEMAEKYDCNVPWLILMDPTSACNLHCIGCWAAEYGYKQNLSFEVMDRTISEAKELGTHAVLFTGGEPLVRKKDIIRLCEKHPDVAFHAFTNGTLIDKQFCEDLLRVKNFMVSVSGHQGHGSDAQLPYSLWLKHLLYS